MTWYRGSQLSRNKARRLICTLLQPGSALLYQLIGNHRSLDAYRTKQKTTFNLFTWNLKLSFFNLRKKKKKRRRNHHQQKEMHSDFSTFPSTARKQKKNVTCGLRGWQTWRQKYILCTHGKIGGGGAKKSDTNTAVQKHVVLKEPSLWRHANPSQINLPVSLTFLFGNLSPGVEKRPPSIPLSLPERSESLESSPAAAPPASSIFLRGRGGNERV